MRTTRLAVLAACLSACASKSDRDSADPGVSTEPNDTTASDTDGDGLHGSTPAAPIPAPADFSGVVGMDDAPRTVDDLLGHPTAMWFYPSAASTG